MDGHSFTHARTHSQVLLNGAQGENTETDRFIALHYQTFVEHMLYLKTEGAAEVVLELVTDSRDIIDDLLDNKALGLDWMLSHIDRADEKADAVDHDFFDVRLPRPRHLPIIHSSPT